MLIDEYGLLYSGGDGGDSCHRNFTAHLRLALIHKNLDINTKMRLLLKLNAHSYSEFENKLVNPKDLFKLLEIEPGIYIRHPDLNKWYSDPRNVSRDQLTPVICYLAATKNTKKQRDLLLACLKRGMFAQNIYPNWVDAKKEKVKRKMPDLLNPNLWGIFARTWATSKNLLLLMPIILLGDFFMVLASLFKCFAPKIKDGKLQMGDKFTDTDDDNINNVLMTAQYNHPTFLSNLAIKIYKKYRRKNIGNIYYPEENNIMAALRYYHASPHGSPELAHLARPLVLNY